MMLSSRLVVDWRLGLPGSVVTQQRPQHVGAAAGKADDGLNMPLAFGAFVLVVGAILGQQRIAVSAARYIARRSVRW